MLSLFLRIFSRLKNFFRQRQEDQELVALAIELKKIKKELYGEGNGKASVDATQAIYLARNSKRFSLKTAEDGKIIFEFARGENSGWHKQENDKPQIQKNLQRRFEPIGDGRVKIYNDNGFTIIDEHGKILENSYGSIVDKEKISKEEFEEKIGLFIDQDEPIDEVKRDEQQSQKIIEKTQTKKTTERNKSQRERKKELLPSPIFEYEYVCFENFLEDELFSGIGSIEAKSKQMINYLASIKKNIIIRLEKKVTLLVPIDIFCASISNLIKDASGRAKIIEDFYSNGVISFEVANRVIERIDGFVSFGLSSGFFTYTKGDKKYYIMPRAVKTPSGKRLKGYFVVLNLTGEFASSIIEQNRQSSQILAVSEESMDESFEELPKMTEAEMKDALCQN